MTHSNYFSTGLITTFILTLTGCNFEDLIGGSNEQDPSCLPIIEMATGEQITYRVSRENVTQNMTIEQTDDKTIQLNISEANTSEREIEFTKATGKECPYYITDQAISPLEQYLISGHIPLESEADIYLGNTTATEYSVPDERDMAPPENSEVSEATCEINPPSQSCIGTYSAGGSSFTWRTVRTIDGVAPAFGLTEFEFSHAGDQLVNIQLLEWNGL